MLNLRKLNTIILIAIIAIAIPDVICYPMDCLEDYSPCNCALLDSNRPYKITSVNCTHVNTPDIKLVFSRTTTEILDRVFLTLPTSVQELPVDLLSGKAAKQIIIGGSEGRNSCQLAIHPDAFDSSAPHVERLQIWGCDLARLNFEFVRKFSNLQELFISGVSSIKSIQCLPLLPNLSKLSIHRSYGFPQLTNFPILRLEYLDLYNNGDLTVDRMEAILTLLSYTPTKDSLKWITLSRNGLTRIPPQFSSFPALSAYQLDYNNVTTLKAGAITLNGSKVKFINLANMAITSIEPGAFVGDFRYTSINLNGNKLTELPAEVYKAVLWQMANTLNPVLSVVRNPFNCDCGLAWLVRDGRHVMDRLAGAACANGTMFHYLDPNQLMCP